VTRSGAGTKAALCVCSSEVRKGVGHERRRLRELEEEAADRPLREDRRAVWGLVLGDRERVLPRRNREADRGSLAQVEEDEEGAFEERK
jgi:hypothetical protein